MKKLSLKSACSIVIAVFGAALPLSAAQAASQDGMGGGSWSSAPQSDASPSIYYDDLQPTAKGPQGPLRTDMIDDTPGLQNEPEAPSRNWPDSFDN